jgi:heme exporter protein D
MLGGAFAVFGFCFIVYYLWWVILLALVVLCLLDALQRRQTAAQPVAPARRRVANTSQARYSNRR